MLTRWDPFRELKGVEAEFDRIVGQALSKDTWVPAPRTTEVKAK